ncbi:response regulator transcription factor [Komagataeibacter sp. FNDCR2]|uniref:response regulator transcription factor n=1 Tax=Komagataeibacter sp. FNDCR2 TaxID=2878682 RepID=UPI001E4ED7CB|nr:response regulator transcription factor [Komagataeibacter sp. FNDCR2]MCE2576823.1 response regulator transcription factor [Komagataeibacter sp. FNDCR2]
MTMSGPEGVVETLRRSQYDIAVIQQVAPDVKLLRHIRNSRVPTPIMIIARDITAAGVAEVLSVGADDCVPASVDPVELLARLRAIIRRASGHDSLTLQIGRLTVSVDRREAHIDGKPVPLTKREYDIVELLALRKGQVLSKEAVLDNLYAGQSEPHGKVIDVMICQIRKKMRNMGIEEPFTTLWGIGYRLNEDAFIPLGARMNGIDGSVHPAARESSIPVTAGIKMVPSGGLDIL